MKPSSFRLEDRIIPLTVLVAAGIWMLDAAIDAWVFSDGVFLGSLLTEISPHEFYFRSFMVIALLLFGIVVSTTLRRRKYAEDELRNVLTKLEDEKTKSEAIIAAIPDGISIRDLSFRVLYQNKVHKNLLGDHVGLTCYEAYSHRKAPCPDCPVERSFTDGGFHISERIRTTNQGSMHLEIFSAPLRNAQGEIVAGIEAVRDISERKRFEENLRLFSTAIEVAMDGVQIVDMNGRILYSNKAIEEIYGFRAAELAGRHVNEMNVAPEFASAVILPSIREHGRWNGELLVRHKEGREFPVWLSCSLVKNTQGTPIAMIGILRDITNRRRTEEELNRHRERLEDLVEERTAELRETNRQLQEGIAERVRMEGELARIQKMESLGLLAGGIAHDFNNLLGSIMGNISLALLDMDKTDPAYERLNKAENASLRAQELTQQLLTFSRGGAPVKRPTAIARLITEAAGFSLSGSRVLHELALAADLWAVDADEGQMMQVFSNILINADQAMPDGGIIRISGENIFLGDNEVPSLPSGRYVRIAVRDEGIGIRQDHLPRIFDPYFTTKQKGSGLGLAATFSIIRRHNGHITVESTLGKGALFTLYLPASSETVVSPPRLEKIVTGHGRVLVMDDDEDMRQTTADMLSRLGYTAECVADGAEAVDAYCRAQNAGVPFLAVIMDLTIPGGMGGQEAIGKLRAIDPQIRAIVSSGYSHDPVMSDFQAYGFHGVVCKPYRLQELGDVVAQVISEHA